MGSEPISVVIPAHDEEAVIGRLLSELARGREPGDEIVVVCDGCRDRTAEVARGHAAVTVIEVPHSGKTAALNAGDQAVSAFPRFYVDADIVVSAAALHDVACAMRDGKEAGVPRCVVDTARSSIVVRNYYEIWTRSPYFTEGILGSGVVGVTAKGRARFDRFPDVIGDDEFVRRLFTRDERVQDVSAVFTVSAPRTTRALVGIKTRSKLGRLQLDLIQGPADAAVGRSNSRRVPDLLRAPGLWVAAATYLVVWCRIEVRVRRLVRRREFRGWARDDTSRVA